MESAGREFSIEERLTWTGERLRTGGWVSGLFPGEAVWMTDVLLLVTAAL